MRNSQTISVNLLLLKDAWNWNLEERFAIHDEMTSSKLIHFQSSYVLYFYYRFSS